MGACVIPNPREVKALSVAFKQTMSASIDRWIEADPGNSKKALAIDLGCSQADLSHWISDKTSYTMYGHLVPLFCSIVGDNSLIWLGTTLYEQRQQSLTAVVQQNAAATTAA